MRQPLCWPIIYRTMTPDAFLDRMNAKAQAGRRSSSMPAVRQRFLSRGYYQPQNYDIMPAIRQRPVILAILAITVQPEILNYTNKARLRLKLELLRDAETYNYSCRVLAYALKGQMV